MKTVLAIMCALMVLFAGGSALALLSADFVSGGYAFALIAGLVALLNVLLLVALYGKSPPARWAFYVLAGLDVLAAILMAIFWSSISFQVGDIWTIAAPVIAVLLVKAVLTLLVAQKLPAGGNPPQG